jgi:tight adherence protein B
VIQRLATALVAAGLCLAVPAAAATDGMRLTPVGHARYPERAYVLTLPTERSVDPAQVDVTENGSVVADPTVSPARESGQEFGVVLVLDTSKSMAGRPIRDAVEAAKALAARRSSDQPLGIVTFNSDTSTLLPLSTDASAIEDALSSPPPLRPETHVYDGVNAAVSMLARSNVAAGTVIVLSDGGDTGSHNSLADAVGRARDNGVRLFSVGLQSGSFEPDALRRLAEGAGGRYSEASDSADLKAIYDQLGADLSREYLVQYRSLEGPGRRVHVEVSVAGMGTATASYRSPKLQVAAAPPYERKDFWGSPVALVLASLVAGGLLGIALLALTMRPERRRIRRRLAMFVRPPSVENEGRSREGSGLADRLLMTVEESLERMRWWAGFKEEVEIARVNMPAVRIVALTVVGTVFFAWLLLAISGSPLLAALGLIAVPVLVRTILKQKLAAQRKLFMDQLGDNLQVIASALRAGHSFIGALTVSIQEAPEPTKSEFESVLADEQLGVPLEDGFDTVARRMECRDIEQVRLVASLQRETGGNTAEVLERVADTVRERGELRRQISSLTAQGRMSRWIVTVLPVALIFVINLVNPEYMKVLFDTPAGNAMLVFAGVLILAGSLTIKKIVDIKV